MTANAATRLKTLDRTFRYHARSRPQLRPANVAQWTVRILLALFIVFWISRLFGIGATAKCADATYSYSIGHWGTCSWHGGPAEWYR